MEITYKQKQGKPNKIDRGREREKKGATAAHKLKFYDNVILLGYFVVKRVEHISTVSRVHHRRKKKEHFIFPHRHRNARIKTMNQNVIVDKEMKMVITSLYKSEQTTETKMYKKLYINTKKTTTTTTKVCNIVLNSIL